MNDNEDTTDEIIERMEKVLELVSGMDAAEATTVLVGAALEVSTQAGLDKDLFMLGVKHQADNRYRMEAH